MKISENSIKSYMNVIKKSGAEEPVSFDKILKRIDILCSTLKLNRINSFVVTQDTISELHDKITTENIDHCAATSCSDKIRDDPQYDTLAAGLCISRLHKMTESDFMVTTQKLYDSGLVTKAYYNFVCLNIVEIQSFFDYSKDYDFDYFGFKTLEKSYLQKIKHIVDGKEQIKIIERPQHLLMRVAVALNFNSMEELQETYHGLSNRYFIFGSPTLYNAGSEYQQLSSCFLLKMDDNLESIFDIVKESALISKRAGGIGISISDIRATGSKIVGTNGQSTGIIPMIQVLNQVARYVNQGGKRNGAIACFCEDTQVFTANGGIKKIQDVKIGDLVVTHKNRLRPVTQTHKNPIGDRKIYKLEVQKNKDIYVTGNHKFWSFYTKNYKSNKLSLGWNSIDELKDLMDNKDTKQICYVTLPSGTNIPDLGNYKIDIMDYKNIIMGDNPVNRIWNITEDLAHFFGMWLVNGHIKKSHTEETVLGIGITVHKDNKDTISYIYKVCKETFGCHITENTSNVSNTTCININCHVIGLVFMELFGKKLPDMIFNWPKKLVNSLIAGLITTDDCITKEMDNATIGLSNKYLIDQIYHLCRNNGIDVSHVEGTNAPYVITVPLSLSILNQTRKLYADDRVEMCKKKLEANGEIEDANYLKIMNITEVNRTDEYVYTLGVEEDHSYTVEGLIVENCYIEPWHADVFVFCELRSNKGNEEDRARDMFFALWIPDLFMKRVEEDGIWSLMCPNECPGLTTCYGDEFEKLYTEYESKKMYRKQIFAKDLWFHILSQQIETGMPYMMYKDHVNKKTNQKNLGVIQSSNLCVSGDTYILTDQGQIHIKELKDQQVNVWNGLEWSPTVVKQTGVDKKLIKVTLSNGAELKCTPEHKFYIVGGTRHQKQIMTQADQLKLNDCLIKYELPKLNLDATNDILSPYTHGFSCGSGDTMEPYFVPLNQSLNTTLRWLEGHSDATGTIITSETKESLQIRGTEKDFLIKVKLMLQVIGIDSKVTKMKGPDNKGFFKLVVTSAELYKLIQLGFSPKKLTLRIGELQHNESKFIKVIAIEKVDVLEDTYCFTEEKRNMGMFNGLLTGQCSEIVQFTSATETAVCNLSSICLPRFVKKHNGEISFNYEKLKYIAGVVTRNLNSVIDINYYPVEKAKTSNMKHRPIGIGIQGLADVYCLMEVPYDSNEARIINRKIFETIYFGALTMSNALAMKDGPYESFHSNGGCPFSQGQLQWHLWNLDPSRLLMGYDWDTLIKNIMQYGTRNSLLTTVVPTASTSQIMGNTESYEAPISNVCTRTTLAGEFTVINKILVEKLIELGIWNKDVQNELLYDKGSVQNISCIPDYIKKIYKTAFELQNKPILIQSIERGPFIDQSQSFNMFQSVPDFDKMTSAHFYGWKGGLKTGMYYLKTQPAVDPINFGLDIEVINEIEKKRGITRKEKREKANENIVRPQGSIMCDTCTA